MSGAIAFAIGIALPLVGPDRLEAREIDKKMMDDYGRSHPQSVPTISGRKQSSENLVRIVYLVPTDKAERDDYREAIARAVDDIRAFYQDQLRTDSHPPAVAGIGETFTITKDPVEVYSLPGSSDFYNSFNAEGPVAFFVHVLNDAFAVSGGQFDDPQNRWVYYVDVDNGCGQVTGTFGGVALLPANDLRGLTDQPSVECPPGEPHIRGFCGTVGGLGHELGHAFGLPHPPGCDEGNCSSEAFYSIMFFGYAYYPDTYFLDEDRDTLHASPFISKQKIKRPKENCRGEPVR